MVKNLCANARDIRDMGSIPGSGRSSGAGNGTPLQWGNFPAWKISQIEEPSGLQSNSPWSRKELDIT